MTFVITQNCCNDASCVPVCPVDCIRPVPTGGGIDSSMLYIDPDTCVDCGACLAECPVGAIYFEDDLPPGQQVFRDINADYFADNRLAVRAISPQRPRSGVESGSLRVAIVGSGPAACYAATELMRTDGVEVSMFERLPTPYGLIRSGVAPDHQRTKEVVSLFEPALASENVRCYFNVTVGQDISHEDLLKHHHAVIDAVGAPSSRALSIPGEQLPGSLAASDFVAWYNGDPDHAGDDVDLSGRRVAVIGNGNVALDVARVLVSDPAALARTDLADHALRGLAAGSVDEVVIIGRRGVADAAFSIGEFLALGELPDVDIVVEGELGPRPDDDFEGGLKYDAAEQYRLRPTAVGHKRIVFVFGATPVEIVGDRRVEGVRVVPTGSDLAERGRVIDAPLVLRSVGYRGSAIAGLPFDDDRGVVPSELGRVRPGVYVTGWIKRGPRGVIGTNRGCALETVTALFDDFHSGRLDTPAEKRRNALGELLAGRGIHSIDWQGWQRIDDAERRHGAEQSRPRVKAVVIGDLLEMSHSQR